MKIRLLVMNGQRLIQVEQSAEWVTEKVEKAGLVKPGIYNIHLAATVDKARPHEGPIIHADKDNVYQQVGKRFVKHSATDFDKVPEMGSNASIKYDGEKAVISNAKIKLGRHIS